MNVGAALKKAREAAGLRQGDLAKMAELNTSYISLLENNHKSPTLETFVRLCTALKVSPTKMMAAIERHQ